MKSKWDLIKFAELVATRISASQIAGIMGNGMTRSGAAGLAYRMKLSLGGGKKAAQHRERRQYRGWGMPAPPHIICDGQPQAHRPRVHLTTQCKLEQLTEATCKWPLWDSFERDEHYYCGANTEGSPPYCPWHAVKAYDRDYVPVARREPARSLITVTTSAKGNSIM
jgi:GcrA cell cycle regulator